MSYINLPVSLKLINEDVTINGTLTVTGAVLLQSTTTVSGVAKFADGAVGAPSIAFTTGATTGIYHTGTTAGDNENILWAITGVNRMTLNKTALTLANVLVLPATATGAGYIAQTNTSNTLMHFFGTGNTFLGYNAGNLTLSGALSNTGIGYTALTALTSGDENTTLGYQAGYQIQTGIGNTFIGYNAGQAARGNYNTSIGDYTLGALGSGDAGNVALGYYAGRYETGNNGFYINNIDQTNTANEKAYSLMYGTFAGSAATIAGQTLVINAALTTTSGLTRKVTAVNAATYDLLATDDILDVTYTATGAVTSLTLPTAQMLPGRTITIFDGGHNASVNNITIDTEGGEKIYYGTGAQDTLVLNVNDQSVTLTVNAAGTAWQVI